MKRLPLLLLFGVAVTLRAGSDEPGISLIRRQSSATLVSWLDWTSAPKKFRRNFDDTVEITKELLRRREVGFLLESWKTSPDPGVRATLVGCVLFQIDDERIARAFEKALSERQDDEAYYVGAYLAKRDHRPALAILNRHFYQYDVSSLQWSYCLGYFGRFGFREAIPNLVSACDSASLNVVDAAVGSLQILYPGSPESFGSIPAAKAYFSESWRAESSEARKETR